MRYLSVCSGIEAATCAWHHMGWEPVGFSEIEPFPSAVLAHHYPQVPNLGDMTKYREWNIGAIDLLVGGTPCQSFSVAGLRKGLEDPRGNLALVYCGILDHFKPRWFVWENVPGVLSSNGGRDFGSFLGAVAELGYGFAYRVLDAQYFGVAQRRRRVFVVGYLGDWEPAAKVLFEPESLRGNPAPSREKGKEVAGTIIRSTFGGGPGGKPEAAAVGHFQPVTSRLDPHEATFISEMEPVVGTLDSRHAGGFQSVQSAGAGHLRAVTGSLTAKGPCAMGAPEVDAGHYLPISIHPHCIGRSPEAGPQGKEYLTDGTAYCMDSRGQPQAVVQPIAFHATQDPISGSISPALGSNMYAGVAVDVYNQAIDGQTAATLTEACGGTNTSEPKVMQAIAFSEVGATLKGGSGERGYPDPSDGNGHNIVGQSVAPTLTATNDPSRSPQSSEVTKQVEAVLMASMAVRRLTPVECERLQGFPDNYTEIPWRGKTDTPDGPRYKALGNSMAVPVMRWIGERIKVFK